VYLQQPCTDRDSSNSGRPRGELLHSSCSRHSLSSLFLALRFACAAEVKQAISTSATSSYFLHHSPVLSPELRAPLRTLPPWPRLRSSPLLGRPACAPMLWRWAHAPSALALLSPVLPRPFRIFALRLGFPRSAPHPGAAPAQSRRRRPWPLTMRRRVTCWSPSPTGARKWKR